MIRYDHSSDAMSFWTNGVNERARIDSSGRLLVGTSTARTINASHTGQIARNSAQNYDPSKPVPASRQFLKWL
jgi:hypothetical protein